MIAKILKVLGCLLKGIKMKGNQESGLIIFSRESGVVSRESWSEVILALAAQRSYALVVSGES